MKKILSLIALALSLSLHATHNRAGEILYQRIAPFTKVVNGLTVQVYTYSFTIIKYTNDGSSVADRCEDTLYFGDGERGVAPRINGSVCGDCSWPITCGVIIYNQNGYVVKKNIYTIVHTYAGPGNYLVRSLDPNRNEGVKNIPNSVNLPFYIESFLVINSFTGANSSPTFSFDPIDRACLDKCFYHNPGAYDIDGDSLSYELTTSRGADGNTVPGYFMPNAEGGTYTIDPITGLMSWCSPKFVSQYNLAFIVKEWRKNTSGIYQLVGYVLRDMQVIVLACPTNDPPTLQLPTDTCVEAGTLIDKVILADDPNQNTTLTVIGGGGAFSAPSPTATPFSVVSSAPLSFNFTWQTQCQHIRQQPYISIFKVKDNHSTNELVNFGNYSIRVVAPAIKNVSATPTGSDMKITWDLSPCNPANNPIVAYKIYRKGDCTPVVFDPCKPGVDPTLGFTNIGQTASTSTFFIDTNNGNGLVVGQDYNYLVVAEYSDGSLSYASAQVCSQLKRDVPILLNVDVLSTSANSGSVFVRWARPLTNNGNLDTLLFTGPYTFNLLHRSNGGTFTPIFSTSNALFYYTDTSFTHTLLNTNDIHHEYKVEFSAGTTTIGTSQKAHSIFLSAVGGDRKVSLNWVSQTPWINSNYTVFRKDPGVPGFVAIGNSSTTSYVDENNVVNRYEYCYKVLGNGAYSDPSIFKPLLNNSQEVCANAVDQTAPCSPTLNITSTCLGGSVKIDWNDVSKSCSDDVIKYILYRKETVSDEYVKLDTIQGSGNISFTFDYNDLVSSCYAIQSVDSSANVSAMSADYCIDNCPEFELPNIISLNGDGINDFFKAIKVRQIKEIDLHIFDRWGNLVYKTKDPYFKWDGKSIQSGLTISDGTFFYICDVYEPRVTGVKKRNLKGYMQVVK
ncbi:MAG: gliding motility-associated C-terminal domain-containing protein [Sphingobacteriaceae bacterium]|nr:gliding motility-associated C-terminal domain-containing protein [Sphingobacteriaceae bacterium]